jgi:protein farnesyltransferase/geranylgeranyltransferase type-1 subunit alpha
VSWPYRRAYRAKIIFALNADLVDELEFIDIISKDNHKNYQVYHHRQRILEAMLKQGIADLERELKFTEELIFADNKNYHVWSYRYSKPPRPLCCER